MTCPKCKGKIKEKDGYRYCENWEKCDYRDLGVSAAMSILAKHRWAKTSKKKRTEYARKMLKARWGKKHSKNVA